MFTSALGYSFPLLKDCVCSRTRVTSVCHMCAGSLKGQKKTLDYLELESEEVMTCSAWVPGNKEPLQEQVPVTVKPFLQPQ